MEELINPSWQQLTEVLEYLGTTSTASNRITPSYVAFNDTERLIGDAAKNQAAMNASNTVFDAKRLIGIESGGKPVIQVTYKSEVTQFAPEEISSMVLIKMKEIAEAYLGREVKNAVITVP
eukprot:gene11033-23058_t